jgi:hypothetical protein
VIYRGGHRGGRAINLDIWADGRDESLEDAAALPAHEVITEEIVANLQTAFEQIAAVCSGNGDLRSWTSRIPAMLFTGRQAQDSTSG